MGGERKNILIKRIEIRDGRKREAVEEVMKMIGARVDVEEINRKGRENDISEAWT